MADFMPVKGSGDTNVTYHYLVLNMIANMTQARAAGKKKEYVSFFMDTLQMLAPYLPAADARTCEEALLELDRRLQSIRERDGLGDNTKDDLMLTERFNFSDEHKFYIYRAFSEAHIISKNQEGELDFEKLDFDTVIRTLRNSSQGITGNLKDENPKEKLMKGGKDELP